MKPSLQLDIIETQQASQRSFIGGKPCLPPGQSIPTCNLCGTEQTFFFQVALPEEAGSQGTTLSLFNCTACADENRLIPEMAQGPLRGAEIPEGFLSDYQENFRILVFPSDPSVIVEQYVEKVAFREMVQRPGKGTGTFGKLFGNPEWLKDDESPGRYGGTVNLDFLMQINYGFVFSKLPDAPQRVEVDYGFGGNFETDHYQLFLNNAVYLFRTVDGSNMVYVITQVD